MMSKTLIAFFAFIGLTGHAAAADGAACRALSDRAHSAMFAQILDAPTNILSATVVAAGANGDADLPEHCQVEGNIAPQIGFLARLPITAWNGKFMMGGCGGACGTYMNQRIDPALARGYAVIVTDMGHKGMSFEFMRGNPQGQADFAYRSTHLTAVVGKTLVETFYGKKAARNYYWGCSTGGRQGMMEAQRFPEDFEGIIAGAPVWNQTQNNPFFGSWGGRVNTDKDGKPILDAKKIPLIHDAVLAACDVRDGLKDGLLMDPRQCRWDPGTIVCKGATGTNCLSAAEVDVVRQIYDGPKDPAGTALFWGMQRGSEDQWRGWLGSDGKLGASVVGEPTNTVLAFVGFADGQGKPYYAPRDFDLARDPPRLGLWEFAYNAQNPDLRRFRAGAGKAILYTGWNDNNIPPGQAIDYYDTATRTMGGDVATTAFFRMFLLPAVNHCNGGAGGSEVDWIAALENWVERGQAPDVVTAHHPVQDATALRPARFPMPPGSFDRARPVFAYPDVARYSGRGDPALPESWAKARR